MFTTGLVIYPVGWFSEKVATYCGSEALVILLSFNISGLFCTIGLVIYPVGWSSEKVATYCGSEASAFHIDQCSLGT